jgi:hypothetical protein
LCCCKVSRKIPRTSKHRSRGRNCAPTYLCPTYCRRLEPPSVLRCSAPGDSTSPRPPGARSCRTSASLTVMAISLVASHSMWMRSSSFWLLGRSILRPAVQLTPAAGPGTD